VCMRCMCARAACEHVQLLWRDQLRGLLALRGPGDLPDRADCVRLPSQRHRHPGHPCLHGPAGRSPHGHGELGRGGWKGGKGGGGKGRTKCVCCVRVSLCMHVCVRVCVHFCVCICVCARARGQHKGMGCHTPGQELICQVGGTWLWLPGAHAHARPSAPHKRKAAGNSLLTKMCVDLPKCMEDAHKIQQPYTCARTRLYWTQGSAP